MAELADAPDLGSGGAILVGSSPSPGNLLESTSYREKEYFAKFVKDGWF